MILRSATRLASCNIIKVCSFCIMHVTTVVHRMKRQFTGTVYVQLSVALGPWKTLEYDRVDPSSADLPIQCCFCGAPPAHEMMSLAATIIIMATYCNCCTGKIVMSGAKNGVRQQTAWETAVRQCKVGNCQLVTPFTRVWKSVTRHFVWISRVTHHFDQIPAALTQISPTRDHPCRPRRSGGPSPHGDA